MVSELEALLSDAQRQKMAGVKAFIEQQHREKQATLFGHVQPMEEAKPLQEDVPV